MRTELSIAGALALVSALILGVMSGWAWGFVAWLAAGGSVFIICLALMRILERQGELKNTLDRLMDLERKAAGKKTCSVCGARYDTVLTSCPGCGAKAD